MTADNLNPVGRTKYYAQHIAQGITQKSARQRKRGRKMEYLRKPTQEARRWVQAAQNYEGATLGQVYNRWSAEKQRAYDECYEKFCNEPNSEQFSIILHNSFHFTVSWFSDLGVRIETACRSICIPWECVESMAEH